ncbi:hypothetical protein LMG29542_07176 [Paraburkholderia humisilvae]|uniref:Uncharacterized protein n=1 Tax=Paraburkholderia humisilvae TaxID=627669 RepID=A0A6J5F6B8_9BURK|nr:hypothetical protein LMG29542_07176 [Paraburkholderia humisilvae]
MMPCSPARCATGSLPACPTTWRRGAFVQLDAAPPLMPNGKLDHLALPEPDDTALVPAAYEAPIGPVEQILAGVWRALLGV